MMTHYMILVGASGTQQQIGQLPLKTPPLPHGLVQPCVCRCIVGLNSPIPLAFSYLKSLLIPMDLKRLRLEDFKTHHSVCLTQKTNTGQVVDYAEDMEVAMEKLEDDSFFADLTKQISLLIMDDDEDPVATCPSVSLQAFSCAIHPLAAQPGFLYEQSCRTQTKGTGVFIPQSTQPRRKHRRGRFASHNTKSHNRSSQADHHNKGMMVPQVSSDCAFRPKN